MAEQEAPRTAQLMRENQRLRQQLYECREHAPHHLYPQSH